MKNLENIFKALGDKNRLRILKLLEKQSMCVCELAYIIGITQPSVSKHIKKLKSAGLIKGDKEGFWTHYYIDASNPYSKVLLSLLATWVNDEKLIKDDWKKYNSTDIKALCCKIPGR